MTRVKSRDRSGDHKRRLLELHEQVSVGLKIKVCFGTVMVDGEWVNPGKATVQRMKSRKASTGVVPLGRKMFTKSRIINSYLSSSGNRLSVHIAKISFGEFRFKFRPTFATRSLPKMCSQRELFCILKSRLIRKVKLYWSKFTHWSKFSLFILFFEWVALPTYIFLINRWRRSSFVSLASSIFSLVFLSDIPSSQFNSNFCYLYSVVFSFYVSFWWMSHFAQRKCRVNRIFVSLRNSTQCIWERFVLQASSLNVFISWVFWQWDQYCIIYVLSGRLFAKYGTLKIPDALSM